jgi:heme/copper-type cytochrome/quinol oxidase subunit 2
MKQRAADHDRSAAGCLLPAEETGEGTMPRPRRFDRAALLLMAVVCLAVPVFSGATTSPEATGGAALQALPDGPQDTGQPGEARTFHIVARKYAYSETRLEVHQNDLVKITFETADIAHSFTIDEPYRIAKRAAPGHPVVFEFPADQVGTFEFYCNLKTDDGCRKMKGQLVVTRQ